MTNKEFEDKKQDIFKNLDKALGFLQNEDLYKCSNIIWDTMKDLKQLQPPKPPTCATCKHFTQELSNTGYCYKGIGQDYIRFTDGVTPFVFMDFSCNKHSDYGDEK